MNRDWHRELMRTQAVVTKFDDVGLATISGSKIKAVKYTKQEGTLRHFSNLATEIKQLEKIGMTMDEFSKTDLCGHIMEIFAAQHHLVDGVLGGGRDVVRGVFWWWGLNGCQWWCVPGGRHRNGTNVEQVGGASRFGQRAFGDVVVVGAAWLRVDGDVVLRDRGQ